MAWKDTFTRQAQKEGYQARSIYKLKELDKKFNIFRKGDNVLDLGCFPGSWLQYAKQQVKNGTVIGVDLKSIPKLEEDTIFIKKDVFDLESKDIPVEEINIVISDMAPSTTGVRDIDQAAAMDLSQRAFDIAKGCKAKVFVCKYFQGPETDVFIKELKQYFAVVKTYKPKSSRAKSIEMYVICKKI